MMKVIITSSGKEYNITTTGFYDTVDGKLKFRILKDNYTLDEIYKDFSGDTSSLKFMNDDQIAYVKNGFEELLDFHPIPNEKIGRDTLTNSDKYADVVDITLSSSDFSRRLANSEDAIMKLSVSVLGGIETISKKSAEMDEYKKTMNDRFDTLQTSVSSSLSKALDNFNRVSEEYSKKYEEASNGINTKLSEFISDYTNKCDNQNVSIQEALRTLTETIANKVSELNDLCLRVKNKLDELENSETKQPEEGTEDKGPEESVEETPTPGEEEVPATDNEETPTEEENKPQEEV